MNYQDVPILDKPLSAHFTFNGLHPVPLRGVPGGFSSERRDIIRVEPIGQLDWLLRDFRNVAVGGLRDLHLIRSTIWRERREMLVMAYDVAHLHVANIARLPWWEDNECAVWALQYWSR